MTGPTFTCPFCARTSHNPNDVEHRYCGACHVALDPEMGRELKVSELVPHTVVILTKEGKPGKAMTAWVKEVGKIGAIFYAGELKLHAIFYHMNDELHDDEARLHIFQYLGGPEPTSGVTT